MSTVLPRGATPRLKGGRGRGGASSFHQFLLFFYSAFLLLLSGNGTYVFGHISDQEVVTWNEPSSSSHTKGTFGGGRSSKEKDDNGLLLSHKQNHAIVVDLDGTNPHDENDRSGTPATITKTTTWNEASPSYHTKGTFGEGRSNKEKDDNDLLSHKQTPHDATIVDLVGDDTKNDSNENDRSGTPATTTKTTATDTVLPLFSKTREEDPDDSEQQTGAGGLKKKSQHIEEENADNKAPFFSSNQIVRTTPLVMALPEADIHKKDEIQRRKTTVDDKKDVIQDRYLQEDTTSSHPSSYLNVALNGVASQSSTCSSGDASRGIDGNTDGVYLGSNSVTHTCDREGESWWKVDLDNYYVIKKVVVWNRTDCCSERLRGSFLTLERDGDVVARYDIGETSGISKFEFHMDDVYNGVSTIRVHLPGDEPLSLAEVQVFGVKEARPSSYPNVALTGVASQSSTCSSGDASRGIDGNTDGVYLGSNSVTHTCDREGESWWKVDLDNYYVIKKVVVWNRTDCCSERLSNSSVQILDENGKGVASATIGDATGVRTFSFDFDNVVGKAVKVHLPGDEPLSLAEVQVFTSSVKATPVVNVARSGSAQQSSTGWGGSASRAIDGNTNGVYPSGSVTHTWENPQAWWKLTLDKFYAISKIVIWNRTESASERLSGSSVQILDGIGEEVASATIGDAAGVQTFSFDFDNVVGKAVKVQLPGVGYLSLAEVQVFGVIPASTEALHPNTVVHADFSDLNSPSNSHTPQLMNDAQIQSCAGIGYDCNALRIDRDGPFALIRDVDIGPAAMPECTLIIGVRLESKANERGWIFGHEQGGYDRTILMHDSRFGGGVASAVGKTWQPYSPPKSTPLHEWLHVTAVFKQGGPSWVYVNGVRSDNSVIAINSGGKNELWIGRDHDGGHWADSWIKHVTVMNKALSDFEVNSYSTNFFEEMEDLKYGEPTANPSLSPSQTPTISSESASCDDPNSVENGSNLGDCICFNGFKPDINDGSCTPEEDIENVPKLKIAIEDTEMYASFDGSYGSEPADGTFNQDFGGGVVGGPQEDAIRLFGNAWKAYKLPDPVDISKSTMLKFNFESYEKAEGNAICLDEDKNEDTYGGLRKRCFAIVMSNSMNQVDKWKNVEKVQVDSSGGTYEVNLGQLSNDQDITVNYLAFIQDNDSEPSRGGKSKFSNIEIYDDETSTTLKSLEWSLDGNSNVGVSRHDGPVSVSTDGQTAVYGFGGNGGSVHLVRKGNRKTCVSGFPGCKQNYWKPWEHNEAGVQRETIRFTNDGYSETVDEGITGMLCHETSGYNYHCKSKKLYYRGGSPIVDINDTGHWTREFSEEGQEGKDNFAECHGTDVVSQIECRGHHCDNMRLKCKRLNLSEYRWTGKTEKTLWFSDGWGGGKQFCPDGYYVYRVECKGDFCDDIRLGCHQIEKIRSAPLINNDWPDYYTLPHNDQLLGSDRNPNRCPTGTEVPENECLLAGIVSAKQWGKTGLDWTKSLLTEARGDRPCGCYININNNRVVYNQEASSCAFRDWARSVCKSKTKYPTRTADIALSRPTSIASGSFGNGPKVLSNNANTIAIAASDVNKVAIYTINGSTVSNANVVDGYNPAVSSDGFLVGTVSRQSSSSNCDVSIYGKTGSNTFLENETSNDFTCNSIAEGLAITHGTDTDDIQLITKTSSYNLSCNDPRSRLVTERTNYDSPIVCLCNDGYVNSGPKSGIILEDGYSCISSLYAENVKVTSNSIEFKISTETANDYKKTKLDKRASPNDVEIELVTSGKLKEDYFNNLKKYTLSQLDPGSRYTVTLSNTNDFSQRFPAVTTCSCGHDDIDKTGRPKDVQVIQNNGHVMFDFKDNSKCEEAFSFTRSDYAEEFLADVSEYGVSFTRDYFFIGGNECGSIVNTNVEASDELQYSKLPVGKLYMYCVRAVHSSHYMDHPMDVSEAGNRQLTSSDDTCAPHKIRWEASIHGKITTEPNAGSLPIENVTVTWELLSSSDSAETPIGCGGCSGSGSTSEGGTFEIVFNVDDPFFKDKNDVDIPVKIKFSKMSGEISHKFLCNEGEDDCSDDVGTVVYLKHLQFREPVHVFDDTSIPFSGKVFIADTTYSGSEGCMLSNVEVCLIQERNIGGVTKTNETLVCGETGPDGTYSLPVIIGSRVDYVDLMYHDHAFRPSGSKFVDGMVIEENGYYGDNDFEDVEKSEIIVDVAGGICDKVLGFSTLNIKVIGCEWGGISKIQSQTRDVVNNVPAHVMELQVTEILKEKDGERLRNVWEYFQGEQPEIRRIDLRDATAANETIQQQENQEAITSNNRTTGTEDVSDVNDNAEQSSALWKGIGEGLEHVRFQYDGELKMNVNFLKDNLECEGYNSEGRDSFHLLDYMTAFKVRIDLKYELLENVFCDILDEDEIKLSVDNQVGVDQNEGYEEFFNGITDPDTKKLLKRCSFLEGGCLYDIFHDKDEGKNVGNAGILLQFATGRPNKSFPHIKNIIFRVQGGVTDVSHTAGVFVEGLYSKGPGGSFALPTHEPVMILRDPPGGLSFATYENVVTRMKVDTKADSEFVSKTFGGGLKTKVEAEKEICAGGGFGAIVLGCAVPVKGEVALNLVQRDVTKGDSKNNDEQSLTNEFSTTWSYETSQDPWIAGAMSDVFVVPNLNVMYENVDEVLWDNTTCTAVSPLPSKVVFDLNAPSTKNAMSFYSRYHIQTVKLPELKASKTNYACCDNSVTDGKCSIDDGSGGIQITDDCTDKLKKKYHVVNFGIKGWEKALQVEKDERNTTVAITEWFESDVGGGGSCFDNPIEGWEIEIEIDNCSFFDEDNSRCDTFGDLNDDGMTAKEKCKVCGGGQDATYSFWFRGGLHYCSWYDANDENAQCKCSDFDFDQFKCEDFGNHKDHFADKTANDQCLACGGGKNRSFSASTKKDCEWFAEDSATRCRDFGDEIGEYNKSASEVCCACGGGDSLKPSSGLVPPSLTHKMKHLDGTDAFKPKNLSQEKWEKQLNNAGSTTRLQFSGASGTISMTMKKDKIDEHLQGSCWSGCSNSYVKDFDYPGLEDSKLLFFGVGPEIRFMVSHHKEVSHGSTRTTSTQEETSIGFILGDDDPGDEFVVDFFVDKRYGTIIFETVAGQSMCPHEIGTLAVEDPKMEVTRYPSQFVFPDDEMVFEVELSNVGVGEESIFVLYAQHRDNGGGLTMLLDGGPFTGSREFTNVKKDTKYKKTVVIKRGPTMFKYRPIDLIFESACEDGDSLQNDATASTFNTTKSVTRLLFNTQDNEENKYIEYIEPCPKVEWAGELFRDRGFLVNADSVSQEELVITVTNPRYQEKKFYNMTSDRLKDIKLSYRKLGDVLWKTAFTEVDGELEELDFAALYQYDKEDLYGYSSLTWSLSTVPEGTYEIKVGTKCDELGGPTDIDMFDAPALTGVIDLTQPEQYGKELPLRESVLIGEEISILFTEPLQCEKPFTFDLKVIIEGTDYEFDREELQVVCEGRRIGFQIDPTVGINVEDILGKTFTVELGRVGSESVSNVYDVNGNGLDPLVGNIKFEKKFGELNLQEASSSFVLTLDDYPCVDNTEDDIKTKVASILGLASTDRDRITLNAVTCHGITTSTAEVVISPPSSGGGRMLRRKSGQGELHSVGLFYQLRDAALEVEAGTRKLSFEGEDMYAPAWSFAVSRMKILPSASDMEMLKTDSNLIEEEENLLHLASLDDAGDKHNDVILQELRMGLKHGDERMDAIQKHGDEKMEAMLAVIQKQNADEKATMQKREDEKMEAMQKREDEKMEAMQKHEAMMLNEMHSLQTQLAFVTLTCVIVSVVAFLKLKN